MNVLLLIRAKVLIILHDNSAIIHQKYAKPKRMCDVELHLLYLNTRLFLHLLIIDWDAGLERVVVFLCSTFLLPNRLQRLFNPLYMTIKMLNLEYHVQCTAHAFHFKFKPYSP